VLTSGTWGKATTGVNQPQRTGTTMEIENLIVGIGLLLLSFSKAFYRLILLP